MQIMSVFSCAHGLTGLSHQCCLMQKLILEGLGFLFGFEGLFPLHIQPTDNFESFFSFFLFFFLLHTEKG